MKCLQVFFIAVCLTAISLAQDSTTTTENPPASSTSSSSTDSSSTNGDSSSSTSSTTDSPSSSSDSSSSSSTSSPSSSTSDPSQSTTTQATPFDPNEACKERYQRQQSQNGNVTGEMREGNPCQYECYRTNNRQRKVRFGIHNVDDFSSCGTDKVCYRGDCKDNNTPSGKACKEKHPGQVYGEPLAGGRRCKARCHTPESNNEIVNQPDGTICGQGRNARHCQNGDCN